MIREHILFIACAVSVPLTTFASEFFSIDRASPSIGGVITPGDVLQVGPVAATEGFSLGLHDDFFSGFYDDLDALSLGKDPIVDLLYFSVDRVAVGKDNTAVKAQAQPGSEEAAGDVFRGTIGDNELHLDESDALALTPGFFGDDLDALALDGVPEPYIYFSVDANSALNDFGNQSLAADILVSDGNSFHTTYAAFGMMGLQAGDDIDALVLLDAGKRDDVADPNMDMALFSLSSFSPTLGNGVSPGDILLTDFDGSFTLFAAAASLGLRDDDELNALDTLPEPGTLLLFVLGSVFLATRRLNGSPRMHRSPES